MPADNSFAQYRARVERDLTRFFAEEQKRITREAPVLLPLFQSIRTESIQRETYLRSAICLASFDIFGGRDTKTAVTIASAFELLHRSLSVHNDVTRQKKEALHSRFAHVYKRSRHREPEHTGYAQAIVAGDMLFLMSAERVYATTLTAEEKVRVLKELTTITEAVVAGRSQDVLLAGRTNVTQKEILELMLLTTASTTTAGPLMVGALLADASKEALQHLTELGNTLGIALHIQSDISDGMGFGKKIPEQGRLGLLEGKQNILCWLVLHGGTKTEKQVLLKAWGKEHISSATLREIRGMMIRSGAYAKAKSLYDTYRRAAYVIIERSPFTAQQKKALAGLIEKITPKLQAGKE